MIGDKNLVALEVCMKNASYEELAAEYGKQRQEWMANDYGGNGVKTHIMGLLNSEMSRRSAGK